ncbi:Putative alpha/Beta hydrolase [Septoria linicola]|uniref:Alpha/Beta hydrolase n=1 Tax=Septoria linicola TaxID=215465 RepID=A0A9Q9EF83_9PEZI|nr:Putative alpha/Beta hydrolase [Septoria linicola]
MTQDTSRSTVSAADQAKDRAIQLFAQSSFHQCFHVSATEKHDRLRVTFATTTNFDQTELPVVLFVGPMFGNRYFCLSFDKVARENGVRVICIDRPGTGGSTAVPIKQRINVWLETVPQLLRHLAVDKVSLLSHSAGTIYLLNTLYHLRSILDEGRPYAALLAPWVSQKHSNMTLLTAASKLPDAAFSGWSGLVGFINNNLAPMGSWSGGIVASSLSLFQAQPGVDEVGEASAQVKYGTDLVTANVIESLHAKYAWAEGMTGANDEARLCLAGGKGLWGSCEDFGEYIELLSAQERASQSEQGTNSKLKVQVFFAGSDNMIGKEGQAYFESCWQQQCVDGVIDYTSTQLVDRSHETIVMDYEKGGIVRVFQHIGAARR